jgi:hypothetical protein
LPSTKCIAPSKLSLCKPEKYLCPWQYLLHSKKPTGVKKPQTVAVNHNISNRVQCWGHLMPIPSTQFPSTIAACFEEVQKCYYKGGWKGENSTISRIFPSSSIKTNAFSSKAMARITCMMPRSLQCRIELQMECHFQLLVHDEAQHKGHMQPTQTLS